MSLAARHAYRNGYLKSEKWQIVRLEALVREKGKCEICGRESHANDAHHIWYPDKIYDTTERHLAVLCRPCHILVHTFLPECKTRNENEGRDQWFFFRKTVIAWRLAQATTEVSREANSGLWKEARRHSKIRYTRKPLAGDVDGPIGVSIHIADERPSDVSSGYRCTTFFRLNMDLSTFVDTMPPHAFKNPDRPVSATWGNKRRTRSVPDLCDTSGVYLVRAGAFCMCELAMPHFDPETNARTRAMWLYLMMLPADWPCFIFEIK